MKKFLLVLCLLMGCVALQAATATANGITWTYQVSNGKASITDRPSSTSGAITIPSTLGGYPVTSIERGAFSDCSRLTSVTIPSSVTEIGYQAFSRCSGLTSVTIPEGVTSIGNWAFAGCSSLTSVTIPSSVTEIGFQAFAGCSSLTSVTISSSVTFIGGYAFYGCSSLTSIDFKGKPPRFCSSNVFEGVSATLFYSSQYASEWEAEIDANGKWNGLPVAEMGYFKGILSKVIIVVLGVLFIGVISRKKKA